MKAIVVTEEAAGTAGMTLAERPEPPAAINDVIVEVHASGFVPTEMAWPSTWVDRANRDRTNIRERNAAPRAKQHCTRPPSVSARSGS